MYMGLSAPFSSISLRVASSSLYPHKAIAVVREEFDLFLWQPHQCSVVSKSVALRLCLA